MLEQQPMLRIMKQTGFSLMTLRLLTAADILSYYGSFSAFCFLQPLQMTEEQVAVLVA